MTYRSSLRSAALAVCLAVPLMLAAAPAHKPPASLAPKIEPWMQKMRVPGVAIARIEDGQLAWTAVYGERAPGKRMTPETVFNVASLTKPVFALMTLHLIAEGKLGLDSRLADDWVDPDIARDPRRKLLTPRLVLSHQSGLPNWRGGGKLAFQFKPGARHEYSGEGYEYLRRAIERRTGESMTTWMRRTVLAEVSMPHTSFGWNPRVADHLATGYGESGQAYPEYDLSQRAPNAAANMMTTIEDYGRFAAWVSRGADLPKALFAEMIRPQSMRPHPAEHFGLGWRIAHERGHALLSPDGRERGVRTQVFVMPETGDGLVILTSSENGELLTRPLTTMLLGDGQSIMAALDSEVWNYLQRMPQDKLPGVAHAMIGSPAFMSRLLHAVDVGLIQPSALDSEEKRTARAAIAPYVLAMLEQHIGQEQLRSLVSLLIEDESGHPHWKAHFSPRQARAWIAALHERHARTEVKLSNDRLASYAGQYLMAANNLLITIRKTANGLEASAKGMPVVQLHAETETLFSFKEDKTRFEFIEDKTGKVTALRVIWSASRSALAQRVHGT